MIKYDKFWETLKSRNLTQYDLYTHYNVNRSLLDKLRNNRNIEVYTIDKLCNILHCNIEDIMTHYEDDNTFQHEDI
ncbi:helix-turn-helix transcriptional regulator [Muricomes sp. OA1]|uniref:helix-turn-helix domain-containing protein n=1 Tax=Muricomes sp. OA1 TaxID=2914165 RepID=UPI001F05C8E4|nr:helix-turn-helix transcriptional regulator [Muricomes sp. OA1]MCH1973542.1 helix-turn-helix transcriptional regulator [Muricomes sp. OA1]